jgi:hypothetical protein
MDTPRRCAVPCVSRSAAGDGILLRAVFDFASSDEDFTIASMAGDVMLLGNSSWRIRRVEPGGHLAGATNAAASTVSSATAPRAGGSA